MENKNPPDNKTENRFVMNSIRTKITLFTAFTIIISMLAATILGVLAIRNIGTRNSDQILLLLCESGEKNLDAYFESVEQSLQMVSAYVESDLKSISDEDLQAHLDRVSDIFERLSYTTNGVFTYYYRIDPSISENVKGFWFVNLDGKGFIEHEVTDITQYDTEDTSKLVWFTVPKATGEPIWLPPYITDNLDERVISYNVPVYFREQFVGVIGIEIDYSAMAEQVNNITLYESGYAFINDKDGTIVYHPHIDVSELATNHPKVPDGLLSEDKFIRYTYEGEEKQAVWLPLSNGMRLNVTVPVSEINADWQGWADTVAIIFNLLLVVFVFLIIRFTGRITKPLQELTEVARQVSSGNYDQKLEYEGNDEVGVLTRAFNQLTAHLKTYIKDLNDLAYADALTSVHNKGAFDIHLNNMTQLLKESDETPAFAICVFDCNSLKEINDTYGHDKGDLYLQNACMVICDAFNHSPVFRIGGDEFAAVLENTDYKNRKRLLAKFDDTCAKRQTKDIPAWEKVDIARGMAVYDPKIDNSIEDVVKRADQLMYENKRGNKKTKRSAK